MYSTGNYFNNNNYYYFDVQILKMYFVWFSSECLVSVTNILNADESNSMLGLNIYVQVLSIWSDSSLMTSYKLYTKGIYQFADYFGHAIKFLNIVSFKIF